MEDGRIKRGTRGRGRGKRGSRGRGRGKKESYISDEESSTINLNESKVEVVQPSENVVEIEENIPPMPAVEEPAPAQIPPTLGMEDDISQLEAPTFTTLVRAPPEPMLHLKWNHKVNLIGEKVLNPMIYNCDQCDKPILVYGRMIPCKHVFCLKCARSEPHLKMCPRCKEKVVRVEQSSLGTVYMCMHGGSRYGNTGCRRTYLSQRDLQAHINHRHVTQQPDLPKPSEIPQQRKISESSSSVQLPVSRQTLSKQIQIAPLTTSNLTRANLATLNEQQQKSTHLHPHVHETVADASYYSNALSNYGSQVNNPSQYSQIPSAASNPSQPAPPSQFYSPFAQPQNFSGAVPPQNFHGTSNPNQWNPSQHQQYYR